jgi:hypothetical protein
MSTLKRLGIPWLTVLFSHWIVCADEPKELVQYDALITPQVRSHWAFQPVKRPVVPTCLNELPRSGGDPIRSPIDAFIVAKLRALGCETAAPVASRQLVRRVYLDILGIPPTIAEQTDFLERVDRYGIDIAVDRLVDDLLARPGFGERWARHWLDLVRYAETNGYERDATKPHVWRYRDYVIRSLNEDKPFDRFVMEQIAGDELPDSNAETLIALGMHRLGHWDDEPADPKEDRFDQLDDIVSTTSQVFLALSLGCARCHNHKFEPLTMHDYYRMVAVFSPLERPQNGRTELDMPIGTRTELEVLRQRDAIIATIRKQIADLQASARTDHLNSGHSKVPADVLIAFWTESEKRSEDQKKTVLKFSKQVDDELASGPLSAVARQIETLEQEIRDLRARTPDLPRGYFMREANESGPATHLLFRGKATRPGPQVAPGVPAVLASVQPSFMNPSLGTTRRRISLAFWIASEENPLTARVIVNRVWQHYFGEGIVRTPNDFGTAGTAPSHPELLDWLADWFVHDANWSLKKLHRLILTSSSYRMGKSWRDGPGAADPENLFLWRQNYKRLEVEAMRDSMLAAAGQLNLKMYGPSMVPAVPQEALEGNSDPDKIWKPSDEREASRRTIYAFIKRSMIVPMLEVLDLCDTTRSAAERQVTTIAPQALSLFNSQFVNDVSRQFADRIMDEAGPDENNQLRRAYLLALSREPTKSEFTLMLDYYHNEASQLMAERGLDPSTAMAARRFALEQLCRAILNLNEFAYSD